MSKWAFALVAAVVLGIGGFGCSGGGGGTTATGGTTGANPGDSTAFVTIQNVPGQLQNVYLTGQGRALGDLIAVIRRVSADDSNGLVATVLNPFRRLQLNGFTQQTINLNIPVSTTRVFDHYNLEIQELDLDNGDGTFTPFTGNNQPFVEGSFDAYFRVFPGRQTSITVRLDDSMFDPNNGYAFDANLFQTANYSVDGLNPPRMNGFLSDYLMFDISNVVGLPPFPDASGNATALFVNGDNFALGQLPPGIPDQAPPDPVPFYTLTPIGYVEGKHVGPRTAVDPSTGQSVPIPGTYSLIQTDPRQPFNPAAHITALLGTYKSFTKVLNSVGTNAQNFELLAFPSTHDDGVDDIVLFNYVGGTITNMYFGQMDMTAGTISAFPVAQVTDASNTANEITGTVTGLTDAGGQTTTDVSQARAGHYTLNSTNLPATFSTSGRFVVYRR